MLPEFVLIFVDYSICGTFEHKNLLKVFFNKFYSMYFSLENTSSGPTIHVINHFHILRILYAQPFETSGCLINPMPSFDLNVL
jgi:hypothetical protein